MRLQTTFIDASTLQGTIPAPFAINADDLFAAVLSGDGSSLSAATLLPRASPSAPASASNGTLGDSGQPVATIQPGVDPQEAASTGQYQPTDVAITSVHGYIDATVGDSVSEPIQTLSVCGVNLTDGMTMNFRTYKGGSLLALTAPLNNVQTVATMPPLDPNATPLSPTALVCGNVAVPQQIPDTPIKKFQVSSPHAQGNSVVHDDRQPAFIPFGGRRQFGVYADRAGNYRILAFSEAKNNPSYQLSSTAVLSIADPGPQNPNSPFHTIQLERETGDPSAGGDTQSTAHIRATALSQLPCSEIQKEVQSPPACVSSMRALPVLQAVLNGKVVATRQVESKFARLGAQYPPYDGLIDFYADQYGVPPQFLKAQALRESGQYKHNFRFEFTSINLTRLSGDGNSRAAFPSSQPLIQSSPFSLYVLAGNALRAYQPGTSDESDAQVTNYFLYSQNNASQTQFSLNVNGVTGIAVKRTIGPAYSTQDTLLCGGQGPIAPGQRPFECRPNVFAWIQQASGSTYANVQELFLVHQDTIWQKNGHAKDAALLSPGVDSYPNGQNTVQPTEFSIDYSTGTITTGKPLGPNQRLMIRFWPVGTSVNDGSAQPTVVSVVQGSSVAGAPDLNDTTNTMKNMVHQQDKGVTYSNPEPLSAFLKRNVATDGSEEPFLTAAGTGDQTIEFTVDANSNPIQPRDPRYQFITSQPYASSSYGLLQLTLLPFDNSDKGKELKAVFDPSSTAIYQLIKQSGTNFDLAGHFHNNTYSSGTVSLPCASGCNEKLWEQEWGGVIQIYNSTKNNGYGQGVVTDGVKSYAPAEPQP